MPRSDSIIAVYQDYQMDPSFYRLRAEGGEFAVGGGRLDAPVVLVGDIAGQNMLGLVDVLTVNDFSLEDCYVTTLVKYTSDRAAMPQEVRDSRPYLRREMKFLSPSVICPLGPHALGSFISDAPSMPVARGRLFHTTAGTPVVPVLYAADFETALECLDGKEFRPHG